MTDTRTEYEVTAQRDGDASIDGSFYDTLEEARAQFEAECESADPRYYRTIRLTEVSCNYEGDECVEVREVRVIEEARV